MRKALALMAMILPVAPLLAQEMMTHSPLGYDVPAAPGTTPSAVFPAPVAPAAPGSGVVALSPEEREATLEAAASSHGRDDLAGGDKRAVHGEVGMMMGTHGTRALWGTAAVPLGENGQAVVSVMTGRDNLRYYRR